MKGGDWAKKNKTTCCYSLPHLCSAHQSKHGSTHSFPFTSLLHRPTNKTTQPPPSSASPTGAEWKPGAAFFPLLDAVKILEPRLSQWVSVILGSLSGKFICHRCPYTVAPGGRLDTLHRLALPLSTRAFPLFLSLSISPALPSSSLSLSTFPLLHRLCPLSHSANLSLLLFVSARSTEPGLWTGYSSQEGRPTRISHARHRWAFLSVRWDCWHRL